MADPQSTETGVQGEIGLRYEHKPDYRRGDRPLYEWLTGVVNIPAAIASEVNLYRNHHLQDFGEATQDEFDRQLESSLVVFSSYLDEGPNGPHFIRAAQASSDLPDDIELIKFSDRYIVFVTLDGKLGQLVTKRSGSLTNTTIKIQEGGRWVEREIKADTNLEVGKNIQLPKKDWQSAQTITPIILAWGERANITIGDKIYENVLLQTGEILSQLESAYDSLGMLIKKTDNPEALDQLKEDAGELKQAISLAASRQATPSHE